MLFTLGAVAHAAGQPAGEKEAKPSKRRAIAKLREIVKSEPSIKEVQTAALRYYKLEPERINAMASAANWKGLVPEIEAGMDNSVGHSFQNTKDGLYPRLDLIDPNNPDSYKERVASNNDQLLWRVRAVWVLDRLVFNSESLDVKSLNTLEENLVREVTTLYFSRRRLLASLVLSPPEDEEELFYEQQRLEELTSTLDALTGGFFESRAWKGDLR